MNSNDTLEEKRAKSADVSRRYRAKRKTNGTLFTPEQKASRKISQDKYYFSPENRAKRLATRRLWAARNRDQTNAKMKAWRETNREHSQAYTKRYMLNWQYGITPEDLQAMKDACGNRCQACGKDFDSNTKHIHIDHDHETGKIRGMICLNCNSAEGHLKTAENAWLMYQYMARHENADFQPEEIVFHLN